MMADAGALDRVLALSGECAAGELAMATALAEACPT